MKKLSNVLYIMTPDSYLHCQNETIAIKVGDEEKYRVPSHNIESIVCFGKTTVSTPLIEFCGDRGITLSFHSEYGKFYGRINGPVNGNVLLRKKQYDILHDNDISCAIVRSIIIGKISNGKNLLVRAAREADSEDTRSKLIYTANQLGEAIIGIEEINNIDNLRGIEGAAANRYFSAFDLMLKSNEENMVFECRTKHPPENNINALLSFIYILLKNDVQSALEAVGLDVAAGYLHTLRPGRASLALDMMEELRAPLADRLALSLVNRHQIKRDDFSAEAGEIKLSDSARREVIDAWQKRKHEEISHPFLDEKIAIGLIPYAQAQLLARYIRGDADGYPPISWR